MLSPTVTPASSSRVAGGWRVWLQELRAPFFSASVVPVLLGSAVAWAQRYPFLWGYFVLTLTAAVSLHAGANVVNDYFDHVSGTDPRNKDYVRPFTGGSRMIQMGLLTPDEVLAGGTILYVLGILIGLVLVATRGMVILVLGLIGVLSGFFHTAPPLRLAATGWGEAVVGLNFGVLITFGAYYVQAQRFSTEVLVASLPLAILIAGVLFINEFQDCKADAETGKRHLVARIGKKRAAHVYGLLILASYSSVILGVIVRWLSPFTLLALLTLPVALRGIRTVLRHYDGTTELAPANAAMVMLHMLTGLLMTLGYVVERVI